MNTQGQPTTQKAHKITSSLFRILAKTGLVLATILLILTGTLVVLTAQLNWPMVIGILVLGAAIVLARWVSRWFAIVLVVLIVIGAIAATVSQLSTFTTPITDANGKVVPGSIATMERVKLGGVDQWIVIRGNSTTNPILLFLNGGPGGTQLAWHREYMGALEENFVVVYWEQRGSGKSASVVISDYGRMVPEQYTVDGIELTNYLRKRFGQDKIYLAGQSWGTMLGVWMVQEHPEWFAAYVGIGQMTNPVEDDLLIYDFVLQHARQEGNTELVRNLEANGPPPYHGFFGSLKYSKLFGLVNGYQAKLVATSNPPPMKPYVGMTETPEYGIADKVAAIFGVAVTFTRVYDQLDNVDLETQSTKFEVPVFFAEGRYDLNAMTVLAERYFNVLDAPQKQLVWFEHSGHNPEHEEATAFNDFMVNTVLAQSQATR